jgi:hypothetical protein
MTSNRWFLGAARKGRATVPGGRHRSVGRRGLNPVVLPLEDRQLLSAFQVTSTADDGSTGTLRWAVQQPDLATKPSTIDFNLGNTPATITLSRAALELSNIAEPTTIAGPGSDLLSITRTRGESVFRIDRMVSASLSGLTITKGSSAN